MSEAVLLWLLPTVPLGAGGLLLLLPERGFRGRAGPAAIATAAGVALLGAWSWAERPSALLAWLPVADHWLFLALSAAGVAGPLACVVAAVAFLVLVYAQGYLAADEARTRFFGFMTLFLGGMELLVLSADLLTLLIGWELVGMCSYALIGFWHEDRVRIRAAQRAFVTTRSGDLGLYLAVMAAFAGGGLGFEVLSQLAAPFASLTALGLIVAAAGKSAQLPFSGWLSGAMQGPTPVSALLHSATMVAAGAILLVKATPLLQAVGWALPVVLWLGVATAIAGGLVALRQDEVKQLLAGSTISQYGYIFAALGAGGTAAGMTHLANHAAFKGLLFLGAGTLVHQGLHHYREMGGLRHTMPVTAVLFAVAAAALAALPLTGGFLSKEAILGEVSKQSTSALALLWLASFLTAAYAARAWLAVFGGMARSATAAEARDPGALMRWPMYALAAAALFLALPAVEHGWIAALGAGPLPPFSWTEAVVSMAVVGTALVWMVQRHRQGLTMLVRPIMPAPLALAAERWLGLVDALDGIGRGTLALGRALDRLDRRQPADRVGSGVRRLAGALAAFDRRILTRRVGGIARSAYRMAGTLETFDARVLSRRVGGIACVAYRMAGGLAAFDSQTVARGLIGGLARATDRAGELSRLCDRRAIDGAIERLTAALQAAAAGFARVQTGLLHHYYLFMVLGAGALLGFALIVFGR